MVGGPLLSYKKPVKGHRHWKKKGKKGSVFNGPKKKGGRVRERARTVSRGRVDIS